MTKTAPGHSNAWAERWPGLTLDPIGWSTRLRLSDHDRRLPFLGDLYLAAACCLGDARAITYFERDILSVAMGQLSSLRLDAAALSDVHSEVRDIVLCPPIGQQGRLVEYRGFGALVGWVRVAAFRVALRMKRRGRELQPGASSELLADDLELEVVKRRYGPAFRHAMSQAMASLTRHEQALLNLHYGEHVSMEALAGAFRVHRSTISRSLQTARNQISEQVQACMKQELRLSDSELSSMLTLLQSRLRSALAGWFSQPAGKSA